MPLAIRERSFARMWLCGASSLIAVLLNGCGPGRWAVVNITDDQATVLRTDNVHRDGQRASFTVAVLEHAPHVLDGRLTDFWVQHAEVDCSARTYRLGETDAFRADGRRVDVDPRLDPAMPLRPESIEAAEAAYLCHDRRAGLPAAEPGGPISLLHQFRTGSVLRNAGGMSPTVSSLPNGGLDV